MQTFLPLLSIYRKNFSETAKCLDDTRLNAQIKEATQIIDILEHRQVRAWGNHPAVVGWRGYVPALKSYRDQMLREWLGRGKQHTYEFYGYDGEVVLPPWLSYEYPEVWLSHRSMLFQKDPVYYSKFFLDWQQHKTGYVWATSLFQSYWRVLFTIESIDLSTTVEDWYYELDNRYEERKDAVTDLEAFMLDAYGGFTVHKSGSRTFLEQHRMGDLLVRLQPVQFLDYKQ